MADVKISDIIAGTPLDTDLIETETAGGASRSLTRLQMRSSATEVKADYETNANTNAFTDAEQTKLAGIEAGATADQTNGEIKTAYEANANTNAFTDAEQTKLAGVATGATDDTTVDAHIADATAAHDDSAIAAAASATNYTPSGPTVEGHLAGVDTALGAVGAVASVFGRTGVVVAAGGDYDDAQVTSAASATNYTPASATVDGHFAGVDTALGSVGAVASVFGRTGAVVAVSGDYDADEITETASNKILTSAERTKLGGIETGATADQTGAEIKVSYEGEADTNAYDDAAVSKLAGIEAGATSDQTNGEIKTAYEANANTNAFTDAEQTKLAGIATGATDDTTVNAHIADATAAHAASAISNVAAGNIAATDVQAAINELDTEKSAITRTVNAQTGTSYTLVLGDAGDVVTMDNASANTMTIPTNASVGYAVGTQVDVSQLGAGVTSIEGDTGVTVNGVSAGTGALSAQYGSVTLLKLATDTWLLTGNHDAVA